MTATSPEFRFWIDMTLECIRRDHTNSHSSGDQRGPFLTARAQGLALAALHDAAAIASSQPPLLTVASTAALAGKDPVVAAAAACHQVLLNRYSSQVRYLSPAWRTWLELVGKPLGFGPAEEAGRIYGEAVHALGAGDGAVAAMNTYPPAGPLASYGHRAPATEPKQGYAGSAWGTVMPLLAPTTYANFGKPPGRVSATTVNPTPHYLADFNKVKAKGVETRSGGSRTAEEELIGIFWGYDGPAELGTPPRLYLQVVLAVLDNLEAANRGALGPSEELKLVAAIAIAMADAGISAWHYKYNADHMMWRPVVGIWNAHSGNGVPQLGWLPLGRPDTNGVGQCLTPNFPAYPSGHATFGAAAFQLLRLYLAQKGVASFNAKGVDNVDFTFTSDEYNGRNVDPRTAAPRPLVARDFSSLWKAIVENSLSRVYLGVHWQFDGITERDGADDVFGEPASPSKLGRTGGVWLGAQIANAIAPNLGVTPATISASKA